MFHANCAHSDVRYSRYKLNAHGHFALTICHTLKETHLFKSPRMPASTGLSIWQDCLLVRGLREVSCCHCRSLLFDWVDLRSMTQSIARVRLAAGPYRTRRRSLP